MRAICNEDKYPARSTVYRWLLHNKKFSDQYTLAGGEWKALTLADDILFIADTPQIGTVTIYRTDGRKEVRAADMTEHRKLQVDARKWIAARLLPKKYGDKVEQTHKGDPDAPMLMQISNDASKW